MKELSIEEKSKRYDEAIERAKSKIKSDKDHVLYENDVIDIFPELKESEDEKVKRILHSISRKMSSNLRDIFTDEEFQCFDAWSNAWLEKQGKQKPTEWSEVDNLVIEKLFCLLDNEQDNYPQLSCDFQEIEGIKNWLEYLKDRFGCEVNCTTTKEWSEEDEKMFNDVIGAVGIADYYFAYNNKQGIENWLKSIKDRVQPKKEWSEEDEEILYSIINDIEIKSGRITLAELKESYTKQIDWLKSLRPKNTWKPSEEQMKALNYVVNLMASSERPTENDLYYNILKSLRQQLKKLKG